jgi:hypothetical protein
MFDLAFKSDLLLIWFAGRTTQFSIKAVPQDALRIGAKTRQVQRHG